jgi:hypothetical protein
MKRAAIFLLVLSLLAGLTLAAEAASSYTLPDALKAVPQNTEGLSIPGELPPYVQVTVWKVEDNGAIHLELEEPVPRLKIMEQNILEGVESTIFTKKNATVADAHMVGKGDPVFSVKMIWKLGDMDYIREYATWSGSLRFVDCSASEEVDPAGFEPYTSVVRTLSFGEAGNPISETWQLEGEKDRFTRVTYYDNNGKLYSMTQAWDSVKAGEYQVLTETDKAGNLTALTVKDKKNSFFAKSVPVSGNLQAATLLSIETVNQNSFDDQLAKKYPQLARGLIDYEAVGDDELDPEFLAMFNLTRDSLGNFGLADPSTITDMGPSTITDIGPSTLTDIGPSTSTNLPEDTDAEDLVPIPANARIWALNFGTLMKGDVYAFITTDPVIVMKDGKAVMNPDAVDVNGDPVKLKKSKLTTPPIEIPAAE